MFSDPHFIQQLTSRGTLCRITEEDILSERLPAETSPDVTVAIAVFTIARMPAREWQLLRTASRIITSRRRSGKALFWA